MTLFVQSLFSVNHDVIFGTRKIVFDDNKYQINVCDGAVL